MGGVFILISSLSYLYSLRQIKNKTAGNGQHGTARWASKREIHKTYKSVQFEPQKWRENEKSRPTEQGIVVGCESKGNETVALVDSGDVHCMMIGAAGVGKTAYWLYPNIEYRYLADRANSDGQCWPSERTIAQDLKISKSTVKRAIEDLKRCGYISVERRYRKNGANSSLLYVLKDFSKRHTTKG